MKCAYICILNKAKKTYLCNTDENTCICTKRIRKLINFSNVNDLLYVYAFLQFRIFITSPGKKSMLLFPKR